MPSLPSPAWFDLLVETPAVHRLVQLAEEGGAISGRGSVGSSTHMLAGALHRRTNRPVLLVVAHLDDADEAVDELAACDVEAARFPAMELLPGETSVALDLLSERLLLVQRLRSANEPPPDVIVAPIQALMQGVPDAERLAGMLRIIEPGMTLDLAEFSEWLDACGYQRVETIEGPGEFSVRGGIIDIFPAGDEPARIDLFGDEVDSIAVIDLDSMGSDRRLDRLHLVGATVDQLQNQSTESFLDSMPDRAIGLLSEVIELTEQGRSYFDRVADSRGIFGPPRVFAAINERCRAVIDIAQFSGGTAPDRAVDLPIEPLPAFDEGASVAVRELIALSGQCDVVVCCQNEGEASRMAELRDEALSSGGADDGSRPSKNGGAGGGAPHNLTIRVQYVHRGFVWRPDPNESNDGEAQTTATDEACFAVVPYHELLHRYQTRRRVRRIATGRAMDAFVELEPGDYVVHRDHGIARFAGLRTLEDATGTAEEYLTLEFARGAKLNVPASKIDLVQRYIGASGTKPELSTFGGKRWSKQKEKVSEAVRDLAAEMLRLQAARESMPGIRYPADTSWQIEFEAEFPYEETDDQLSAIQAVKRDMTHERPMDRLVCGDVGFGKTEVAIRAAFKVAEYGKQVAVLVPTTVLAEQHDRTFRQRFAGYPFRVETISRFRSSSRQKEILHDLALGKIDIIIGTHRLLSKDVKFADLGLVIVDEEQRFGVEHKQRLLTFRATCDVLTLSATPIPRTLHMSLLGLRDISSLTTPPLDRRAIVTEVIPHNRRRLKQILERELAREGQVFYVHNRVHNIQSVADDVQRLVPDAKVIYGHGQMPARQLEKVMLTFFRGEADILVSTTIIESGIDIPTANTMVINDAHMFGLSELHQLRGRVGRHKHRAYCYLLLPKDRTVNETAVKRLHALENFSMLGAGFKIALRDLELRGAGNLLGAEQSGHIAAVGYEMYCQLLEQAVSELRDGVKPRAIDTVLDLGITGSVPKGYIPSDTRRMDVYRRISQANDLAELERVRHDLASAYGDPPARTKLMLNIAEARLSAAALNIKSITRHENDVIFRTRDPRGLEERMRSAKGTLRIVGTPSAEGLTEIYYRPPVVYFEGDTLITVLRHRLAPREDDVSGAQDATGGLERQPAESAAGVRR